MPKDSYNKINEEIVNTIANNYDEYINFINNKESNLFNELFIKNSIEPVMIKEVDNHNINSKKTKIIISKIKLFYVRIKNFCK